MEQPPVISRRQALIATAWGVPVLTFAVQAPAEASSPPTTELAPLTITLVTTIFQSDGYSFSLEDGKWRGGNVTTGNAASWASPDSDRVVLVTFRVTDEFGEPVSGISLDIGGDDVRDSENNFMISVTSNSFTANHTESSTQRRAAVQTDANGEVLVRIGTATYNLADCGYIPRTGVITVISAATSNYQSSVQTYTYRVRDEVEGRTVSC